VSSKHVRGFFPPPSFFLFLCCVGSGAPLTGSPGPERELLATRSKAETTHFAVLLLSVNMLICTELSRFSLNQTSSLKEKPIVDLCGE